MTSPRRKPLVAGNWKMHRTGPEAVELIQQLRDGYTAGRAEVMVPNPALPTVEAGGSKFTWLNALNSSPRN